MTQETLFVTSVHMKIREIKCCLQQMDELANNSDPSSHSKIPKIQVKIPKIPKIPKQNTLGRPISLEALNLTLTSKNVNLSLVYSKKMKW